MTEDYDRATPAKHQCSVDAPGLLARYVKKMFWVASSAPDPFEVMTIDVLFYLELTVVEAHPTQTALSVIEYDYIAVFICLALTVLRKE